MNKKYQDKEVLITMDPTTLSLTLDDKNNKFN